ncbi:helix-turn-helix domain-containing protein [Archaeoglobus neptunius]|uniref:helix-turn-helix domain-containing protein n=1 Tax=Archaeoglobus neptunius TaxID=2798580 RepID=UPI001927F449|nr:helix-turn-helix domain-containing protein [Archaeoglobus neptunius]
MSARLAECIARGENFGDCLRKLLAEKGITPAEFSKKAGLPKSTLYKILNGYKPRYDTLAKIFSALYDRRDFIALIAARYVLEDVRVDERVRVYPTSTLEDAIVAIVRAEKDGARAIVCAPILSSLAEKLVDIPVMTIKPGKSVEKAVEHAIEMVSL